jgi:octaheme c-type cytochrome (tetrathionate reductase family)
MQAFRSGHLTIATLLATVAIAMGMAGCSDGKDGKDGTAGLDGTNGTDGTNGLNCWDLNANGVADFPDEDTNDDGVIDVYDCRDVGGYSPASMHKGYFTDNEYTGTGQCLNCHGPIGSDIITTGHWKWEGVASGLEGLEGEIHGKRDMINNFCMAVPSNEGRCTQCHIGYNYADKNFDFGNPENIDCLVCHDRTGTYKKAQTTAGNPDPSVDLQLVAQSVAEDGGRPDRLNCIGCHANAGGGDNVKHGDISTDLIATTAEYDVHMGTDGGNFDCIACHEMKRGQDGELLSHGIGGMAYHSVDEGNMKECTDCHGDRFNIHAGTTVELVLSIDAHDRLACQVCHIPAIARKVSTMTNWRWSDAGQDIDPIPTDPATGRPLYDKKKGTFEWSNNVRPTLRYYNGKWNKFIVNVSDRYTSLPAVLGEPVASYQDADAMIYPFKKMVGNQPADANNNTVFVPHLFGLKGGENPYWAKYDWDLAIQDGAAYTGQTYSGDYEFVDTVLYLKVDHEVAPAQQAYGMDGNCNDCHNNPDGFDWTELGWTGDPIQGGTRP